MNVNAPPAGEKRKHVFLGRWRLSSRPLWSFSGIAVMIVAGFEIWKRCVSLERSRCSSFQNAVLKKMPSKAPDQQKKKKPLCIRFIYSKYGNNRLKVVIAPTDRTIPGPRSCL